MMDLAAGNDRLLPFVAVVDNYCNTFGVYGPDNTTPFPLSTQLLNLELAIFPKLKVLLIPRIHESLGNNYT